MNTIINLSKIKKIHFTGIKGVGMTALALCARDMGIQVTGSDITEHFVTDEILKRAKLNWQVGFSKSHLTNPDLLIFTAAHGGSENIEVKEAQKQGIPTMSQGEAVGLFMRGKVGISVCGVGGKTTTAAMTATIMLQAKQNPSFAIGAASMNNKDFSGKYDKKGKYFIAEADEYYSSPQDLTTKFLYQKPKIIIITNIEFDHPDVYKDLHATLETFSYFVNRISDDGLIVANIDNLNVKKLIQSIKVPLQTYGFNKTADWQIVNVEHKDKKIVFMVRNRGIVIKDIELFIPGVFNVKNATAALAVSNFCGIASAKVKQGLASFRGTKRRFELISKIGEMALFDDYAHHPTEIMATLEAAKSWFRGKRIIAIFQPHTYSRTKALFKEFATSFTDADKVYITPIYASAREKESLGVSSEKLVKEISKFHPDVNFIKDTNELSKVLRHEVKKDDIIMTLGAGDIFTWHRAIIKSLKSLKF